MIEILDTDSDEEEEDPDEPDGGIPVKRETRSDAASPPCGLVTPGAVKSKGPRRRVTFASDYTTPPTCAAATTAAAATPAAGLDQPAGGGDLSATLQLLAAEPAAVSQGQHQAAMAAGLGPRAPDCGPRQHAKPLPQLQSQPAVDGLTTPAHESLGSLPTHWGQGDLPARQSQGDHPIMGSGSALRPPPPQQHQQHQLHVPQAAVLGVSRKDNVGGEQHAAAVAGCSDLRGTRGAVGGRDMGAQQHAPATAGRSEHREGLRSLPDRSHQRSFPVVLVVQPAGTSARHEIRADMALSVTEDGSIAHEVSWVAVSSLPDTSCFI